MIEFNNISKSFKGINVLTDFNLVCEKGKIQCLVGKNGAGKSTLINISTGLLSSNSGNVKILEKEINPDKRKILDKVGFVLENPLYIEQFTAIEQLQFLGKIYKIDNLKHRINELIEFFDLPSDKKRISEYSTGMKSKVSLACALIHSPKVLILDEPFEGLDIGSYDALLQYLKEYASNGNTILITTHQVDVIIEISDYTALIKDGKLAENLSYLELYEISKNKFDKEERSPIKRYIRESI